ncbi:MAG TPA: nuclear transport factor 2 family protein [Thermomicrobiaceae bacterium]|nr:nuclear transport factor 2 family protein [Thermomicrobiaceae bacterium]
MSREPELEALFDRWNQVWLEDRYDLIPTCLAPVYTRHGSMIQSEFTVTYTAEEYGRKVVAQRERTRLHFVIHDRAFVGDRAWFRHTLIWTDPDTGQTVTRPAIQVYRVEDGRMAETWVAYQGDGSAWPEFGHA